MGRKKAGDNPNSKLCALLYVLADYEKFMTNNTYKSNAYRQAAEVLRKHPVKIKSGEEAKKLGKIGLSIAEKIDQFYTTGKIAKVEEIKKDEKFKAILTLIQVSGIGPSKARELVKKGLRTIQDLKRCPDTLNRHQLIGLTYFEDFQMKIPVSEIDGIERILIQEIAELDGKYIVTICGSYRRGKPASGDVDCLITHPNYTSEAVENCEAAQEISLRKIVSQLKKSEFVVDTIALGQTKFMGVCKLSPKKPARRLDLRLVPMDQFSCAILYFTGSDLFNQNIRAHALSQGFTLNEYTLRPIDSSGNIGEPVSLKSEREIFDILNYPYVPPYERDL